MLKLLKIHENFFKPSLKFPLFLNYIIINDKIIINKVRNFLITFDFKLQKIFLF